MATADELRQQLAVAELEDKLVAAKKGGKAMPKLKAQVREARLRHRATVQGLKVKKDSRGRLVAVDPKGDS